MSDFYIIPADDWECENCGASAGFCQCGEAVESLQSEVVRLREQNSELKGVLQNLVNLKNHKDHYGKDKIYKLNQPEAWERAKIILEL